MSAVLDFIGSVFGYVLWFFFDLFDNYSLAIVCFSIIIRAIFFPLDIKAKMVAAKSAKSFAKQAAISKMYKDNPQKQLEETQKLREKEGTSGGGGSLFQTIFQLVSMLGIFRAIIKPLTNMFHISADKVNSAISKLPSLASSGVDIIKGYEQLNIVKCAPDHFDVFDMFNKSEISDILDFNKGFNFFGLDFSLTPNKFHVFSVVWIIPFLCILTSLISIFINQKVSGMKEMPGCFKFGPFLMVLPAVYFAVNMPIAVGFYTLVSNIVMIAETLIIAKFFSPAKLVAKSEAARISRLLDEEGKVKKK